MNKLKVTYDIKTIFPVRNLDVCKANGFDNLVEDLKSINGQISLPIQFFGDTFLRFEFVDKVKLKEFKDSKSNDFFLIIESNITIDIEEIIEKAFIRESNPDDLQPELIVVPYFRLLYKTYLTHFLIFTQIAYPGTLWLNDAVVLFNNKKMDEINGISSVLSEYNYSESKWPKLENVTIDKVWKYLINKTNIFHELSKTEIERGLNSFTHLFSENYHHNIPVSLFWSLSGLESLYVTGEVGITQQLNDKIQTFLGDIIENKKILKKLYNYRSGLIHGDLSIPIKDGVLNYDKYNDDLYVMNSFSAVVLVASLQKIIKNEMTKLTFKYIYE
ncbi:MAG: hypothetical protein KJ754_07535 [Bacteroidetes bacterium]|nr:hypothetical protein [Bacteroidota bacterium]MBU1579265.1 hypothetical protein [Bacteroidota bacterium]